MLILKTILAVFFLSALALVGCDTNSGSSTVTPAEPIQPAGPKTYTVTFVTNAGGGVFTNQTITEGSNAVRPAAPVRSGYNFVDWYKENSFNTVFLFDREKISNHLTLHAKWTTKLVVTFDTTGGSELARQEVTSNEKATKPEDPTRTGFTFKGWFTTAATNVGFDFDTVRIRATTTIYAAWQQNTYTVTFITNTATPGVPAFTVQTIKHGSNAVRPSPDPVRAGYGLVGWFENVAGTVAFNFNKAITKDTTSYAKWEATGLRKNNLEFNLDAANTEARSITYYDNHFYILDGGKKVYAYTKGGSRASALDFTLSNSASTLKYVPSTNGFYAMGINSFDFYSTSKVLVPSKKIAKPATVFSIDGGFISRSDNVYFSGFDTDLANFLGKINTTNGIFERLSSGSIGTMGWIDAGNGAGFYVFLRRGFSGISKNTLTYRNYSDGSRDNNKDIVLDDAIPSANKNGNGAVVVDGYLYIVPQDSNKVYVYRWQP